MLIRSKIIICVALLACLIFGSSGLLLWNAERSSYNHKRSTLAYADLARYLQLSSDVFRTFKQARRDLISGTGQLTFDASEQNNRLLSLLDQILMYEILEENFAADNNTKGSERVKMMRKEISLAFNDVVEFERLNKRGASELALQKFDKSLTLRIDQRVKTAIDNAIHNEENELSEALQEIKSDNRVANFAAIIMTITGAIITAIIFFIFVVRIRNNLSKLAGGAEIFASGNLDYKIDIPEGDEFAKLADRFNLMASQLQNQRQHLEDAHKHLEIRVADRTNELNILNGELEHRDRTRREFFAEIGHELRTPITALRGEAEVALRSRNNKEENYYHALKKITSVTGQITRLVNDIFLIAREQAGVLDLRIDRVDLIQIATNSIETIKSCTENKGALITTSYPDTDVIVEGDTDRLKQVIQILLTNAIKHSSIGVSIQLEITEANSGWEFSISDDGPGITKEDAEQVFERFYRGALSAELSPTGTGLGLPIARSIVQAHGGKIFVDKEYKNGMRILFLLPYINNDEQHLDTNNGYSELEAAS